MKTRRHLPRAGLILPLFMGILLLAARPAAAQFSEAVLAGSGVTNYTGYVIDADQASVTNNAAFNREFIIFQAVVRTTNTTASLLQRTNVYSLRLLGTNGLPVPLYDLSGTTTNAGYSYNITNTISVPALGTNILARVANLRPVSRLNPFDRYTVDFRVLTNGVATAAFTNDGPRPYYHFTNTVSGDASYNVLTEITNVSTNLVYAVDTIPGKQAFRFDVGILLRRYDDFAGTNNANDTIPFSVGYRLETAAGVVVPLVNTSTNLVAIMNDYTAGTTNPPLPRVLAGTLVVHVVPAAQLDCVANNHRLVAWVSHTDRTNSPAIVIAGNTNQSAPERLLHFNGRLVFGSGTGAIITTFNSINNSPANLGVVSGSHVTTTLGVDANSGSIPGRPFHSYGAGAALSVRLRASGNAELAAGSVVVNQPVPDADVVNGVRFVRTGPMVLNTTGGSSPLRVLLPAGFGYRTNNTNTTLTFGSIDFAALPLDANLAPGISPVYTSGGNPIFAAEESKPLWFECSSIQWDVPASRFLLNLTGARVHYVRWDEYDYLKNSTSLLVDPAQAVKRSNERVFQPVNGASNVEIDVDPNGAALLKAQLLLGAGSYPTHFPYDSEVTWFAGGGLTVSSDLISSGGLTNVNPITLSYSRDCPGCAAQLPNAALQLAPSNGVLRFTRDGGLIAAGTLTATNALTWGYFSNSSSAQGFAQQAFMFSNASYHMPGSSLRGDQTGLPSGHTPAALLYTGVAATNLATVERPDFGLTPAALAYRNGFADYAGLNFAVGTNGARQGASLLAGKPTGTYQLTGRSKYYVRLGGVSGIHEAVPGTFPAGLTLYGYPFTFSNYGLNYLDSQNRDSRTDGSVSVPHPSQFTQNFKELKLTCVGGLTTAEVPSNDPDKVLSYWTADFATLSIDFQRNPGETCNPGAGYLVLGTRLTPYQLGLTNLYGSLGFLSSGDLIPQSFGLAGVDSRLKLPNVVRVAGPNAESYNLTAVSDAYLNTYGTGVNTPGWLNVAGGLDVSFFEDIKVHLQTSPDREGTNAIVHLAGGWPKAGSSAANQGWTNSTGGSFFTVTYFDPDNAGLPNAVTLSGYRDSSTTLYHPRAQKTWLQVVEFDYPLDWNTLTRSFKSHSTTSNDFLVVKVQHEVKYLSAGKAELVFGVQYDGLPQVNLTELAFNAVDEATGVAKAVANAAGDEILGAVTNGIDRITQMLDANMQQFFGQIFDQVVNPVIDTTYSALSNSFQVFATNNPCNYLPVASSNIDYYIGGVYGAGVNLSNQISTNLLGAIGQVSNVVGRIDKFLADVQLGIDAVIGNITNDINGNVISNKVGLFASTNAAGSPAIVSNLIFQLTSELAAEFISSVVNPALDSFIQEHQPTIDQVIQVLTEVRAQVAAVRAQLAAGQEFQLELVARVNGLSGDILQLCNQTRLDVSNYFASIDCTIDDPFQDITAAEIKLLIRQKFEENFFASRIPQQVGELLKQKVYDLDGQMREGIDTLFASLNDVIKDLISETLQSLDTQINGLIGDINSTVGSAQLNGYAHIAGDSLKELRIDGHFELNCPDPMEINAYLIVKELNSDGTETCSTGGGPATEVTLGAQNVDLDWISPDLRANVEVKFSFATTPSFKPIGMAGSFEVLGGLKFETFEITELAAAIAFGANENYLSAATRIRFNQYMMAGGIYFGRTCTLDPIKLWAPDVAAVIGTPPFTGAYVYGEGWFPLNEALGIPSSCLFNISAGVGAGAGYFVEGPTYIGSLFAGLSGEVLCLVSVTGEAKLIGVKQGSDFRFSGNAKVSGEAGSCPFCIKFKKSFGIRYENDSWSLD